MVHRAWNMVASLMSRYGNMVAVRGAYWLRVWSKKKLSMKACTDLHRDLIWRFARSGMVGWREVSGSVGNDLEMGASKLLNCSLETNMHARGQHAQSSVELRRSASKVSETCSDDCAGWSWKEWWSTSTTMTGSHRRVLKRTQRRVMTMSCRCARSPMWDQFGWSPETNIDSRCEDYIEILDVPLLKKRALTTDFCRRTHIVDKEMLTSLTFANVDLVFKNF